MPYSFTSPTSSRWNTSRRGNDRRQRVSETVSIYDEEADEEYAQMMRRRERWLSR